jgi:hypothetical protein
MKKIIFLTLLFCGIAVQQLTAQIIDVDYTTRKDGQKDSEQQAALTQPTKTTSKTPQLLKSGFVNYLTSGNVQASANLMRLNIGDPDKFYIPFYIYTGTSGSGLGDAPSSGTGIANLLNPISGTINLSFNGLAVIGKPNGLTCLKFNYQIGGRVNSGKDSLTQKNFTFFNGLANVGFYFQTGAWKDGDTQNMGVFFVMGKAIGSFSDKAYYQRILGDKTLTHNYLIGYSIDAGIEINKVIDMKLGVYQFTNDNASAILNKPVVSFTLNYTFDKN